MDPPVFSCGLGACQHCESVALTMTSTRLLEAGAFAFALVEVGANRRPARAPMMRVTRAIAATVESVKGVLKNLDIPSSFFSSTERYSLQSRMASSSRWVARLIGFFWLCLMVRRRRLQ